MLFTRTSPSSSLLHQKKAAAADDSGFSSVDHFCISKRALSEVCILLRLKSLTKSRWPKVVDENASTFSLIRLCGWLFLLLFSSLTGKRRRTTTTTTTLDSDPPHPVKSRAEHTSLCTFRPPAQNQVRMFADIVYWCRATWFAKWLSPPHQTTAASFPTRKRRHRNTWWLVSVSKSFSLVYLANFFLSARVSEWESRSRTRTTIDISLALFSLFLFSSRFPTLRCRGVVSFFFLYKLKERKKKKLLVVHSCTIWAHLLCVAKNSSQPGLGATEHTTSFCLSSLPQREERHIDRQTDRQSSQPVSQSINRSILH